MASSLFRPTIALLILGAVAACESPTKPPPAVNAVVIGPGAVTVASGGTQQLVTVITTSSGTVLEDRVVAWTIDDPSVATVSSTGLLTGLLNVTAVNRSTTVRATSEGKVATASVQVEPAIAASITLTPIVATVTETQAPYVQAVVRDAANNILAGRVLTWVSRDTSVATMLADGQFIPKAFLDVGNRNVRIVASIGAVRDSTVIAVAPATVQSVTVLPTIPFLRQGWTKKLRIRVLTQSNSLIDGLPATYTSSNASVASITGGGLLTAPALASGTTEVVATYNGFADTVTVTVDNCGAGPAGTFPIEIRVIGVGLSPSVQQAFDCAVARLRAVIREPISTVAFAAGGSAAGSGCFNQTVTGSTSGLIIYVRVDTIDGPGSVLGRAGPCLIRSTSRLPVVGSMEFDDDDMANLESAGTLGAVIMHEMLHVIGVGTTWRDPALSQLFTGETSDPGFLGSRAILACRTEHGGTSTCATQVPIENCVGIPGCGAGTIYGHWRENTFITELMTGYLTGTKPPFSRMTIEALGDLGYPVDPNQSNEYVLPNPPMMSLMAQPLPRGMKLPAPIMPTHTIDASGRTRRILR